MDGTAKDSSKAPLLSLNVHDDKFSTEELILNPDSFPALKPGQLVEIYEPEKRKKRIILKVPTASPIKGGKT